MTTIRMILLALFFFTICCAASRAGHGPRGSPPPKIVLPGRPMPCLPYCVPM